MEKQALTTRQFGEVPYDTSNVITFPEGLVGFEELRNFILIHEDETDPFRWLLSLDEPSIGFAMLDPRLVKPEYVADIPVSIENHDLFTIVTLHKELKKSTLNLKGPIIIHQESREGKQIILNAERFPVAHPLFNNH
jgi:flagellar assembly factor FliW